MKSEKQAAEETPVEGEAEAVDAAQPTEGAQA
jgi:hypothetical protein